MSFIPVKAKINFLAFSIFSINVKVFTYTFDQFNASKNITDLTLLNGMLYFSHWSCDFQLPLKPKMLFESFSSWKT